MSDESGLAPEAPLIDARSPAERWAEAGRAGFDRLRARIDGGGLDDAALAWMCLLLLYTVLQVYSVFRADSFGSSDWWTRASFLAQTGGFALVFGSVAAVALAAYFATRAAELTLRLALAGGTWSVLSGFLGVVVSFHWSASAPVIAARGGAVLPPRSFADQLVAALANLGYAGLGVVVLVLAWQLLGTRTSPPNGGMRAAAP